MQGCVHDSRSQTFTELQNYVKVELSVNNLFLGKLKVLGTFVNTYHTLDKHLISCRAKKSACILTFNRCTLISRLTSSNSVFQFLKDIKLKAKNKGIFFLYTKKEQ